MRKILLLAIIALSMNAVAQYKQFTNSKLFPVFNSQENLRLKSTESRLKAPAKNMEASSKQASMLKAPALAKYNQLIDSTYRFNWDTFNNKWSSCSYKTINKYDLNNNMTSSIYKYWDGFNWSINYSETYTYDAYNRETSSLYQRNNDTILVNSQRSVTTYDANNNYTSTSQYWVNGVWVNSYKSIMTNSGSGSNMVMERIDQDWDSVKWVNASKVQYVGDFRDLNSPIYISASMQVWDGSAWVNAQQYLNISYRAGFDSDLQGFWTYTLQGWVNGAWLTIQERKYDAISNKAIELALEPKTDGQTDYINFKRHTTTYDANMNAVNMIVELWDTTAWVNATKEIYTIDANKNCVNTIIQTWKSNWVDSCKLSYTFDANKNKTSSNFQNWNGSAWVKHSQSNATYDANSFMINESNKYWDLDGVALVWGDSTYNYYRTVLVGLKDLKMTNPNIAVYPNPTTSSIQIKGIEGKANINVFGIDGKLLLNKQFSDNEIISVSKLPKGIYMVKICTKEGVIEKKLVKN